MGSVLPYGPQIAEHCILGAQLQPSGKVASGALQPKEVSRLMASIRALEAWLQGCADAPPRGFIYSKGPGEPVAPERDSRLEPDQPCSQEAANVPAGWDRTAALSSRGWSSFAARRQMSWSAHATPRMGAVKQGSGVKPVVRRCRPGLQGSADRTA